MEVGAPGSPDPPYTRPYSKKNHNSGAEEKGGGTYYQSPREKNIHNYD